LYITSGDIGSQALKLSRKDGKTTVEPVWKQRKIAVGQGNVVRVGDHVYGLTGDGPAFFACADVKTGEVLYRERGFGRAMLLHADGKFIVLDEDGNLSLVKATPEKYELASKFPLFSKRSWTVPTLVGKTLFVRDKEKIVALDLG
jgi:outer membrane protein assembly factor BamB